MSDEDGDQVGTDIHYEPFGAFRSGAATLAGVTDRAFTGHRGNNLPDDDLGLLYMNARFYLPGTGRFASADTIVPDPADPQSFNRYSYSLNNPLKFRDPSGHAVDAGGAFGGVLEPEWPHSAVPLVAVQPANGFTLINAGENLCVTTQAARGGTRLVGGSC